MKPFNAILKDLCEETKTVYIDNHDSFVLASGALPLDCYHADKVNLRFPGIRSLVHNMNDSCPVRRFKAQTETHMIITVQKGLFSEMVAVLLDTVDFMITRRTSLRNKRR